MRQLTDIFGQPVDVGDKVAVGMAFGRSSVLRIGEVLAVKETEDPYYKRTKWSIRVKWTHNGPSDWSWDVRESTIKYESGFSYAKLVVLPRDFVEQFPPDIKDK